MLRGSVTADSIRYTAHCMSQKMPQHRPIPELTLSPWELSDEKEQLFLSVSMDYRRPKGEEQKEREEGL